MGNGLADGRQIHKDDIAQRFLCVEGDADAGVITVNLDPDMVFGVLGHGFFPSKKQGVESRDKQSGTGIELSAPEIVASWLRPFYLA